MYYNEFIIQNVLRSSDKIYDHDMIISITANVYNFKLVDDESAIKKLIQNLCLKHVLCERNKELLNLNSIKEALEKYEEAEDNVFKSTELMEEVENNIFKLTDFMKSKKSKYNKLNTIEKEITEYKSKNLMTDITFYVQKEDISYHTISSDYVPYIFISNKMEIELQLRRKDDFLKDLTIL